LQARQLCPCYAVFPGAGIGATRIYYQRANGATLQIRLGNKDRCGAETIASKNPGKCRCRFALATRTGAAQKRLRVKTPATLDPAESVISNKSLRLALRTPASVTPSRTPLIASKAEGSGAGRLTAIPKSLRSLYQSGESCRRRRPEIQSSLPWHCLYFFPEPQGHGSFRPTFWPRTKGCTLTSAFAFSSASSWSAFW